MLDWVTQLSHEGAWAIRNNHPIKPIVSPENRQRHLANTVRRMRGYGKRGEGR